MVGLRKKSCRVSGRVLKFSSFRVTRHLNNKGVSTKGVKDHKVDIAFKLKKGMAGGRHRSDPTGF